MFRDVPPSTTTIHAFTWADDGTQAVLGGLSVDGSAVDFFGGPFDSGTATTDALGMAGLPVHFPPGVRRTCLTATTRPATAAIPNVGWTQGTRVFGTVPRDHGGSVEVQKPRHVGWSN